MAKAFTLNGRTIMAKPFDFNMICDLEDCGIEMSSLGKHNTGLLRAYVSICIGSSVAEAGALIQAHVLEGGKLDELNETIAREVTESDFFQKLNEQTVSQEATTSTKKKA